MKNSTLTICFYFIFLFLSSCERPDLTEEIESAYAETHKTGSICTYGQFKCEENASYSCGYSGNDLLWKFSETCSNGCNSSTGKCYSDSGTNSDSNSDSTEQDSNSASCTTIDGNMWSSRSSYKMNLERAGSYCNNLTECGYSDWRLPNINELRTLIKNCPGSQTGGSCAVKDPSCLSSDACWSEDCRCEYKDNNGGYYSKLGDDDTVWLWSSSAESGSSDFTWQWHLGFGNGYVLVTGIDSNYYVRCVR